MPEELELKFSIEDPGAVRRWLDATFPPGLDQRWFSHSMTDRYFDSADRRLFAAGYGARLRRTQGRTTLTLKSDIEVSGAVHRREELEGPATQALDISTWPVSEARERLISIVGEELLVERFAVRGRRRERTISTGGAILLASIDQAAVDSAGVDAGPFSQFEIEWRSGRRAALTRVARLVDESGVGRPESRSKLAMAEGLVAEAARVRRDDPFAEAGRKVMRRHFMRLLEREVATRQGDELALKQMRVATRRLRATWRVFADGYKKRPRRRFTGQLRELGRALGAARDRDVLIASIRKERALAPLADRWRAERADAFRAALELLATSTYREFVVDALAFTATPGAGANRAGSGKSVGAIAPAAVRAAYQRLTDAGSAALASDDPTIWHALRIEGRRFRYSLEAFADVLEATAAAELIARTTMLQDHLGALNDAVVAIDAVGEWLAEAEATVSEPTRRAAQEYVARRRATIEELHESFATVWGQLSGAAAHDLLGSSVASSVATANPALTGR